MPFGPREWTLRRMFEKKRKKRALHFAVTSALVVTPVFSVGCGGAETEEPHTNVAAGGEDPDTNVAAHMEGEPHTNVAASEEDPETNVAAPEEPETNVATPEPEEPHTNVAAPGTEVDE